MSVSALAVILPPVRVMAPEAYATRSKPPAKVTLPAKVTVENGLPDVPIVKLRLKSGSALTVSVSAALPL